MILSFISLSVSYYFFLIPSCTDRECMLVTAGMAVQQMNILIRWPIRRQKLGYCILVPFIHIHYILSWNFPFSFPSPPVFLSLIPTIGMYYSDRRHALDRFYCVHYCSKKHFNLQISVTRGIFQYTMYTVRAIGNCRIFNTVKSISVYYFNQQFT